jgi:arylsulfatase A-like enzyme
MNRRRFLSTSLLGSLAFMAACRGTSLSRVPQKKPNFVFILVDDQRYDALGFLGKYPWLKTPNMDRLRKEGAYFKNAFVTHSICSPSRASFLTGVYSHIHGVVQNTFNDYDWQNCPSFAQILQRNDYKTGYIGKWHQGPGGHERPGFDYWLSFDGQGTYFDPEYTENGKEHKAQGYTTDILSEKAVDFIEKQDENQPFALYLSHKAVHGPFLPAPRHEDAYEGVELDKPANFDDNFETKPQWFAKNHIKGVFRSSEPGEYQDVKVVPQQWEPYFNNQYENRSYTDYYRTLSAVDDGVGEVYKALRNKGMLDDTVIIFAGDNGFFLGEHRHLDKRMMYEESIRIPLLMRYPKMIEQGKTIEELALNIDLAPTILDLAGVGVPSHMQGKSWRPLFEDNGGPWRKSFLYEYFVDLVPGIPTMVGVRTEDWKLIHYPDLNDIDELYDLKNDPHEINNLAMVEEYQSKKKELGNELRRLIKETGYDKNKWEIKPVRHKPARPGSGLIIERDFEKQGKLLICDGEPVMSIENDEFPNLKGGPFTVDVTAKADTDGIVLAKGGWNNGFAVFFQNGIPSFAFRANSSLYIADGVEPALGRKVRITGMVYNSKARLYIDGKPVSSIPVSPYYFMAEPAENLDFGGDSGTGVLGGIMGQGITGSIYRFRFYDCQVNPEDI